MKIMRSELNLLGITQFLIIYWILRWTFMSPLFQVLKGGDVQLYKEQGVLIAIEGVALFLSLWPWAQHRLGKAFFPLIVTIVSFPFFLQRYWFLIIVASPISTEVDFLHAFILQYDLVLLTLLLAWRYAFRFVILYIGVIFLADLVMTFQIAKPEYETLIAFSFQIFFRSVIFLLVAYVVTYLRQIQRNQQQILIESHEQQQITNHKLAQYAGTIEKLSTSQERNRLARELHDTLAHSLTALSVQLEAVNSLWEVDPQTARKMLSRADEITRTGLVEVRRSLQALRATPLEEFGLMKSLCNLAETATKRAGLTLNLKVSELNINLPSPTEQNIYRIAQEALENVARHANAKQLIVQISCDPNELQLKIIDDGMGFDSQLSNINPKNLGIQGMYERAEMIGGTLHVTSEIKVGTQVFFTLAV